MSDYEASPHDWVAEHVALYERTGGAEGGEFNGVPCVILTTTGRKTGKTRKTPLVRVPHGDGYLVVATPEVHLQDGSERRAYVARVADDKEQNDLFKVAVAAYPEYAEYQERCDRRIPVVVLEPS